MITIQDLRWSNWASYGDDNYIDFEQPVLQIMGTNGAGKTSIPIILQELYYGKNSKGKKKASLPNRYIDKPTVTAESNFIDENGNKYKINLSRKATVKLKLTKNGEDISSHTTTNTYKTIQEIIGLDFKTFSQLIYQSSTDNLDFLTATDSNRKKFLINLFGLNKYLSTQDKFKLVSTKLNTELTALNSKISTISSWVVKHSKIDLTEKDLEDLPTIDEEDIDVLAEIKSDLINITSTNKKINSNNQLIELLENLDTTMLYYVGSVDVEAKKDIIVKGKKAKAATTTFKALIAADTARLNSIKSRGNTCISCGHALDQEAKATQIKELQVEIDARITANAESIREVEELSGHIREINEIEGKIKERDKVSSELANLTNSIDDSLALEVLDAKELQKAMQEITASINSTKTLIDKVSKANATATAHNTKIAVILEQLSEYQAELEEHSTKAKGLVDIVSKIELIKKAFGPSGLLSYKIDFLVKDLEKEINKYLGVLSDGKFQLIFKLENEKLNIEIIDEGIAISIEELSAGELARINAATLLAIRKLMAAISSTKINVLFLDEIMGVLDEGGKEMLIEVLHAEKDLNTLLVSHEYSHPLIPKITIIKDNKISRIEYDV